jgi:hypothetical protein
VYLFEYFCSTILKELIKVYHPDNLAVFFLVYVRYTPPNLASAGNFTAFHLCCFFQVQENLIFTSCHKEWAGPVEMSTAICVGQPENQYKSAVIREGGALPEKRRDLSGVGKERAELPAPT